MRHEQRWKVAQATYNKKWLAYPEDLNEFHPKSIYDENVQVARAFRNYQDAMKYAHEQASKRIVMLQHIHDDAGTIAYGSSGVEVGLSQRSEPESQLGKPYIWIGDGDGHYIDIEIGDLEPLASLLMSFKELVQDIAESTDWSGIV